MDALINPYNNAGETVFINVVTYIHNVAAFLVVSAPKIKYCNVNTIVVQVLFLSHERVCLFF